MGNANTDSPIDDIAYLTRSEHRAPALIALSVRPRSRSELWEMTGVSESTIRRTLSEFEARNWVYRDGYQYEATQMGAFVASAIAESIDRIETERQLRDVWRLLPDEETGFTIDMCSDATVTVADPEEPSRPISRFCALFEGTDRLRVTGLDVAMLDSCKTELCRRIVEGMETELINPPRVADYIRSDCPDLFSEALESGNLDLRLHDDLPPFGVGLFDDRTAIIGYDPEGVAVRVLVDTDGTDPREWAESTFTAHRRKTPTLPLENDL
ncbi:Predicted transcriptional regulator, contains HTH domain [Halobiforma haloterrestris]|uniref:Predicted transcriptional regulator, contains HTH domain n=1 Tax=Natronobacterium haloterrestre TaxID=148448 RepID=A0A1I1GF16_NATHA|nr:MarR family transcriptional regulator [Halobiforma haloterrestris]SFC07943.1 Predicted transcriptional regulator, contains HTH domain [Halobiforma haloterrestris]